jgi:hypothetical protein
MRRLLALGLVIAAALAAAGPTSGAAAPLHGVSFELHSDGFLIQGWSAPGSERMRLLLDRHGAVAYYYAPVRVGAGTVRARFGRLGSLDLRFVPGRGEGPLGCGGSEGWQRGRFVGSLVFRGENDFANVDASRAPGWFETSPQRGCRSDRRSQPATAAASRIAPIAETGVELEGGTGGGRSGRYFYFFTENRAGGVRAAFNAFRFEHREGMLIERGAQVYGGAKSFEWDLGTGTATAEPPAPFAGRAVYRRGAPGRPARWTGSLRVPILGGRPMRLTGAAFGARLGRGT